MPRLRPLLLLLLLGACAAPAAGPQTGDPPVRREANRLSLAEIRGTHVSDAYEAVRMLRPNWLRRRGQMSFTQPSSIAIYVDNVNIGGPEALRSLPLNSVVQMEFLDASSATQRWGTNHVHGAIVVRTM